MASILYPQQYTYVPYAQYTQYYQQTCVLQGYPQHIATPQFYYQQPPTRHCLEVQQYISGNQRRSPSTPNRQQSPRKSTSPTRITLSDKNVSSGSIVFLSAKTREDKCHYQCQIPDCKKRMDEGAFNHPAVILQMWDERPTGGEIMTMGCLISANPRPNEMERFRSLPISRTMKGTAPVAASTHLPEEIIYLEQESTLTKQSYIQTNHIFNIPLSKLAPFRQNENRLSKESFSYLRKKLRVEKFAWIPTSKFDTQTLGTQAPSIKPVSTKSPNSQCHAVDNELQSRKHLANNAT